MVTTYITLDVSSDSYVARVKAKKGEKDSRTIVVTLVNRSKAVEIPTGANVVVRGKNETGQVYYQEGTVNTDGTISYTFTSDECAVVGISVYEIEIFNTSEVLYTAQFLLEVEDNIDINEQVEASSQFTQLEKTTNRAEQAIADFEGKTEGLATKDYVSEELEAKQDVLSEGDNIKIEENTVSLAKKFVERDDLRWTIGAYSGSSGTVWKQTTTNTAIRVYDGLWFDVKAGDYVYVDDGYTMSLLLYSEKDASSIPTYIKDVTEYTFTEDCYLRMISRLATKPVLTKATVQETIEATHLGSYVDSLEVNTLSNLDGMKMSILGDSTTTFGGVVTPSESSSDRYSDGVWTTAGNRVEFPYGNVNNVDCMWWKRLFNKYGWTYLANDSWAGSRISWDGVSEDTKQGADIHMASLTRIKKLGVWTDGVLTEAPDLIIVSGASNDVHNGVDIGTFDTSNPSRLTEDEIKVLPVATFADALRTLLIRLQFYYPNSKIVFTTPYYLELSKIKEINEYIDVIKEECSYFGVPVIDSRQIGMNMRNHTDYKLSDSLHLNYDGQKLMYEYADKVLNTI